MILTLIIQFIIPLWTSIHIIPIVGGQLLPPVHLPDGPDPHGCVAKHWVVELGILTVGLPAVVHLVAQGSLVILV